MVENERAKLEDLNRFLTYGKGQIIYEQNDDTTEVIHTHTECEKKYEANLAEMFNKILDELSKDALPQSNLPMEFIKAFEKYRKGKPM